MITTIEADPFSSRIPSNPAPSSSSFSTATEWRQFLVALLFGISLPVGVVVVFFVVVPLTFGPLQSPFWIWFYFLLFLFFTFGPLGVVGVSSGLLGWRLAVERRRRRRQEAKSETEMNAVRPRIQAPIAAVEDLEEEEEEVVVNPQAIASNRTTVSTIMDGFVNSGHLDVNLNERSSFAEFDGRTNDPIFTLSASFQIGSDIQTRSDDSLRRKTWVRASVDDDGVALALGLTLLGCNLSWVWFLMDPRPLSWITFSALGIINSSVNFFLCLFCSQRIAAGFRSFCSALAATVSGKLPS